MVAYEFSGTERARGAVSPSSRYHVKKGGDKMGVILEEPKHKVLDPSPSLKTTGESPPHTLWEVVVDPARSLAPPYRDGRFG